MKIIDWLLRVSKGEIHEDTEFKINGEKIEGIKDLGEYKILSKELLNSTVEIIEEDKGIENNFQHVYNSDNDLIDANFENIKTTLENIIKAINEMREDK